MKILSTVSLLSTHTNEVILLFDFTNGVKTISDFVKQVNKLAEENYPSTSNEDNDEANKFKGDMLEILADIFFNIYAADPAVGLRNYKSVPINEDYGVDGIGANVNGDRCAVQIKFKSNPLTQITYEEVSKTYCSGKELHNLLLDKENTIFVFTTGTGSTAALQKVLGNKVRLIDIGIIAGKIDNNNNFWEQAQELILDTLEQ